MLELTYRVTLVVINTVRIFSTTLVNKCKLCKTGLVHLVICWKSDYISLTFIKKTFIRTDVSTPVQVSSSVQYDKQGINVCWAFHCSVHTLSRCSDESLARFTTHYYESLVTQDYLHLPLST